MNTRCTKRIFTLILCCVAIASSAAISQSQTNGTVTCTMLEWYGRDTSIVQSWLGEELRISFSTSELKIRYGKKWYRDIPFTLQVKSNGEQRVSFQQSGTYDGERHTIDFSYMLNNNGTVSGYATSTSFGTITANGVCLAENIGTS